VVLRIAVFLLAAAPCCQAYGAELQFTASVDRARVGQADPIRLTLTIQSKENISHLPAPQISFSEFHVEGPSISTRVEMVNFETTFARDLIYTLYARRTGRLEIGPAKLNFQGDRYVTNKLAVEVVAGSLQAAPPGTAPSASSGPSNLGDNLFVRTTIDRRQVFVGQQATLEFDLCYRFQLQNVGFKEIPTYSGFWVKELFSAKELQPQREHIENQPFNVAPLKKIALFPTATGTHTIEPLVLSCEIPRRRRRRGFFDDFDDFFGRSSQAVVLRGEPVEIQVTPLPSRGRPADFKGGVGQFEIAAEASPPMVRAGDPVTLTVRVVGRGNIDAINLGELSSIEGFKVYDPKVETIADVDNGVYGGVRSFEYILIPEQAGRLQVPPIQLAYFDPDASIYRYTSSGAMYIEVTPGADAEAASSYGLSRQAIQLVGSDIRHIKPDLPELTTTSVYHKSWLFWFLQLGMPGTLVLLFLYKRRHDRLSGDRAYVRRRNARAAAEQRLDSVAEMRSAGNSVEIHAEVHRAVTHLVADLLHLTAVGLTQDELVEALEGARVAEKTVNRVRDLVARCDYARFAPASASAGDAAEVEELARKVVESLDREV
jgi:hypothetical protein